MAAKMASYCKTHSLLDAFMKTGNLKQQRHTLLNILTHKRIIDDTKHVLQHVKLNKKATVGVQVLHSINKILKNIFKSTNVGRITNQQHAWVNVLLVCLFSGHNSMDVTARMVGKQTGLARGKVTHYLSRSLEKALIIHSSNKKRIRAH
jgi:hypothetical protein